MIKGLAVTVLAAGSVTIAAHPVPGPIASPAALVRVSAVCRARAGLVAIDKSNGSRRSRRRSLVAPTGSQGPQGLRG